MGKLITVVGNSGVGKTTLTNKLCAAMPELSAALEQHAERPFHHLFAADLQRYALANQIDFLLYRAEQEQLLRKQAKVAITDGGLDLDFHGFAKLFHQKGYLTQAEFLLCQRQYGLLRQWLGTPDLVIHLVASVDVIQARFAQRGRAVEITQQADLHALDKLIKAWVATVDDCPVLTINMADDAYSSPENLTQLIEHITTHLA